MLVGMDMVVLGNGALLGVRGTALQKRAAALNRCGMTQCGCAEVAARRNAIVQKRCEFAATPYKACSVSRMIGQICAEVQSAQGGWRRRHAAGLLNKRVRGSRC